MGGHGQANLRQQVASAIERADYPKAKVFLERLRKQAPPDADVLNNLAVIYDKLGLGKRLQAELLEEANTINREHPAVKKNLAEVYYTLGIADLRAGKFDEAILELEKALALLPKHHRAHLEMGHCLYRIGKMQEAIQSFTRAVNLEPTLVGAYTGLGVSFMELKMLVEAKGAFQQVLRLEPHSPFAFMHLGLLANMTGLTSVAVNMLRRALALAPESPEVHNNLGLILREQGDINEAYNHYKKTIEFCPSNPDYFSGYLLTLNYLPGLTSEKIAQAHRQSDKIFPAQKRDLPRRDRDPLRKLRIGFLSPDFRTHSVAYFILGVLEEHDSTQFEITGYSTGRECDDMTHRIEKAVAHFIPCHGWSNDRLATRIQEDGIDVLIELSGHTSGHRLAMLRNRVAPIQMTYLGYPNTTGLSAMDWRITDDLADPPGQSDPFYSEKLARIDGGFLAYSVTDAMQALTVNPLPGQNGKTLTFGSFNNLAKVNDDVLAAWAKILGQVPHASLVMKARGMRDERVQSRLLHIFRDAGIHESRVILKGHELFTQEHLACYKDIDLALDTFPYAGTTTTCEALWMGVPVVTLAGEQHAGRVGVSILTQVGLEECIGQTNDDYIERAVQLALDIPRLVALREGMRKRMMKSPLMNPNRLARGIEHSIRQAWVNYCQA